MSRRRRAVLLCGPSPGSVRVIAEALAGPGTALLVQAAPRQRAAAERLRRALAPHGGAITVVSGQLGGDGAAERLVREAWAAAGAVDIVVLCPSLPVVRRATEPGLDAWQVAVDAGLRGPFFLAKHAALRMRGRGGRLIFGFIVPLPAADHVAAVVGDALRCLIDALAKAVPRAVTVAAAIGVGPARPSDTARLAAGVRFLCASDPQPNGTVLDLGAAGQ